MRHIFGPVPSRRLGRSLGVDLVPFKTCTYDCIYCQLGRTTARTVERKEWVPLDGVLAELEEKLGSRPDWITLSGSGEPTLFAPLDRVIAGIRARTDTPVAVLTNGSLLWREEVRREIGGADLVIPSLDAGDPALFEQVNRPHPEIAFERMVQGLLELRREFAGEIWLEVFFLAGLTAEEEPARAIAELARRIGPDRVQLNTVTRPATEEYARTVERERMEELARLFDPPAEVIADYRQVHSRSEFRAGREAVLEMLRRRPCSLDDIAGGLDIHRNEAVKHIEELDAEGLLEKRESGGRLYYHAKT